MIPDTICLGDCFVYTGGPSACFVSQNIYLITRLTTYVSLLHMDYENLGDNISAHKVTYRMLKDLFTNIDTVTELH